MNTRTRHLVASVTAVLLLLSASATVYAQGTWRNVAPFPEPREELLGASAGGKLYVFSGLIPLWKPAGVVYEYDPAADKWTKKKPMALPAHHVALASYNNKVYAFGGFVYPTTGGAAWVPLTTRGSTTRRRIRGRHWRRCQSSAARRPPPRWATGFM